MSDFGDEGWTLFVPKNKVRMEKRLTTLNTLNEKKKSDKSRFDKSLAFLKQNKIFQKNRLHRDELISLIQENDVKGRLYVIGHGRCVGHPIEYVLDKSLSNDGKNETKIKKKCLQCKLETLDKNLRHCCCSSDILQNLPAKFYFGLDGPVNNYLTLMDEERI